MGGRSHDHHCEACGGHWSPFDFDRCPCRKSKGGDVREVGTSLGEYLRLVGGYWFRLVTPAAAIGLVVEGRYLTAGMGAISAIFWWFVWRPEVRQQQKVEGW